MGHEDMIWRQMIKEGWKEQVSPITYARLLRHVRKWNNYNISNEDAHLTVKNLIATCKLVGCKWEE